MSADRFPLIFDGHNDTVLSMAGGRSIFERSDEGHIDLPRAVEGGLGGGFFAVFIADPLPDEVRDADPEERAKAAMSRYLDEANRPPMMELAYAQQQAISHLARLFRAERESGGKIRIARTAAELERNLDEGVFTMVLHFEGAEPLDTEGDALEVFYQAGVRSLGLTWSRRNRFSEGVPFRFPSSPDVGDGLTDAGKQLVRDCNRLGIMIDLSHLNEKGFRDVAAISDAPLVATHSNVHAISASARNLTDWQLDAIRDTAASSA